MKRPALAAWTGRGFRAAFVLNRCRNRVALQGRTAQPSKLPFARQAGCSNDRCRNAAALAAPLHPPPGSLFHLNFCQSATVSIASPPPKSSRPAIRAGPQTSRRVLGSERASAWAAEGGCAGSQLDKCAGWMQPVSIAVDDCARCAHPSTAAGWQAEVHTRAQVHMLARSSLNCGRRKVQSCHSAAAAEHTGSDGQQADPGPQALHGPEESQAQRVAAGRGVGSLGVVLGVAGHRMALVIVHARQAEVPGSSVRGRYKQRP